MSIRGIILIVLFAAASAHADAWSEARARQRQQRAQLSQLAADDRAERADHARTVITDLVALAEQGEVKANTNDLWQLLIGLARLSLDHLGDLPQRVRALPKGEGTDDPAWSKALTEARAKLTARPWELLQRAADVGSVELAVEFMWEVLYFDPGYAQVRRALGQVKVDPKLLDAAMPKAERPPGGPVITFPEMSDYDPDRYWLTPFQAARLKQGLVWHENFGWIIAKHGERYAANYVYDFDRRKWADVQEANAYHSKAGRDWVLRTDHVEVRGTADLHVLAEVATKLEAVYKQIFGHFATFFTGSREADALRLALGLAEHDPLVVWVYRDREEYIARADAMQWSGGLFRPSSGESFFYGRPSGTMYHEFTHQVLHVMTGKNESPQWLTEGIAEYTQTPMFSLGRVTMLGAPYDATYRVDELMQLRSHSAWNAAVEASGRRGIPSPYSSAGSLVTFCMDYDDGRFRADFLDFLRDSYRGQSRNHDVWEYLGLGEAEFTQAYLEWGRDKRL